MKFRFIINSYSEIQACCEFLINRWKLNAKTCFYLQLYTEEYFTNLMKYTSYTKNAFGLQASYISHQLHLLFWDKTLPFNPKQYVHNALGIQFLTKLFPCNYRTLRNINFFGVKISND